MPNRAQEERAQVSRANPELRLSSAGQERVTGGWRLLWKEAQENPRIVRETEQTGTGLGLSTCRMDKSLPGALGKGQNTSRKGEGREGGLDRHRE